MLQYVYQDKQQTYTGKKIKCKQIYQKYRKNLKIERKTA